MSQPQEPTMAGHMKLLPGQRRGLWIALAALLFLRILMMIWVPMAPA